MKIEFPEAGQILEHVPPFSKLHQQPKAVTGNKCKKILPFMNFSLFNATISSSDFTTE